MTGFLSSELVNADALSKHYVGIEIKTYQRFTGVETIERASNEIQEYYNAGNINQCSGDEDGVIARLMMGADVAGDLTIATGNTTKTWTQQDTIDGHWFHLKLRNYTFSPCKGSHSGSWYHY